MMMIMTMTTIMMKKSGKDVSAEPAPVADLSETELVSTSGTLVNTNTNTNANTNTNTNTNTKTNTNTNTNLRCDLRRQASC